MRNHSDIDVDIVDLGHADGESFQQEVKIAYINMWNKAFLFHLLGTFLLHVRVTNAYNGENLFSEMTGKGRNPPSQEAYSKNTDLVVSKSRSLPCTKRSHRASLNGHHKSEALDSP